MLVILVALGSALAMEARAQGKDPFLPPPGAGPDVSGDSDQGEPPAAVDPDEPTAPGDGLARTGQDVAMQLALGLVLFALGCAFRMAERGAALAGHGC